jgi:NhaP-type Na+/H+ or K+/H+ antiporter
MVPVFLALAGTELSASSKLFIGWFGPRGLASIVFAIIVFDAGLPGRTTLAVAAATTVLLSMIAHGITANPSSPRLLVAPASGPSPAPKSIMTEASIRSANKGTWLRRSAEVLRQ